MTALAEIVSTRSAEWAEKIMAARARGAASVIATGNVLRDAKADCEHGEWLDALGLAGMAEDGAQKFMAVADNPVLANTAHVRYLPSAYSTLYELSRLEGPVLEGAIVEGKVRPDMERVDARRLLNPGYVSRAHLKKDDPEHHRWVCPLCQGSGWVDKEPREGFERIPRNGTLAGKSPL